MRQVLRSELPEGANVDAARQFMEQEGFICKVVRNGTFVEKTWFGDREPVHDDIDFLDCTRVQTAGHLLMPRTWRVGLVLEGDVVEGVLVSHYIDGP